jgi:N-acetylglucosaminyldiphosphoundecaprenol N-acetyl-beta-D-mannosaminyltransferase
MSSLPPRYDVFGIDISLTTRDEVVRLVLDPPASGLMVAIANVHTVMSCRRDPALRDILDRADIATPDGVPLVWALRASGHETAERVTGIDVMRGALGTGRRHYFYGSTEETLAGMRGEVLRQFPGAVIVGTLSPPFRDLSDEEHQHVMEDIRAARPDVVWVGLGMPKQERWIINAHRHLPGVSLVGVGAAFDWLAGTTPMAPQWMRDRGLEWLFRLVREPRRLWRRYAYNNPAFMVLLTGRYLRTKVGLPPRRPST